MSEIERKADSYGIQDTLFSFSSVPMFSRIEAARDFKTSS